MKPRTLSLRRERLAELSTSEMSAVAGASQDCLAVTRKLIDALIETRRPTQCWCP